MKTLALLNHLRASGGGSNNGMGVIRLIVLAAFTLSSTIAFSLVSGTWMFYQRAEHPYGEIAMILGNAKDVYNELYQWVALALFACIVLVPAVQSLTAQAAVVTASGREQRFAVLRLLGVSAQQITRMTVAETALYSLIGIAAGLFGYACLLPALTYVEFQGEQIRIHELLLPWWGYLAVAGVLLVIAVASAWFAMQRVRIDPLGVAKRAVPAAVRGWQAVIGVGLAVITLLALRSVELTPEMGVSLGILMPAIVMIAVVYLIAPFAVQLSAKVVALLPGSAHYVAVQRVAANPKLAWRRVAVSAFLGWIIGFLVASPIGDSATWGMDNISILFKDITTGIFLTLGFGYALMAISLYLGQAAAVFESAELTRSLHLVGVGRWFLTRVALWEVMGPMLLASLLGFANSSLAAVVLFAEITPEGYLSRFLGALTLVGLGWVITVLAILAVEPLRGKVFARLSRRQD